MTTAPMLEQRETMVALGWTVVSDCGYSHRSGWTIGIYRVRGKWVVELWEGMSLHANADSPVKAAKLHRELIAAPDSTTSSGDLDKQQDTSGSSVNVMDATDPLPCVVGRYAGPLGRIDHISPSAQKRNQPGEPRGNASRPPPLHDRHSESRQ